MQNVIERTPVIAQCPKGHTWESEILSGSTICQTVSCPECAMMVSSYYLIKEHYNQQNIQTVIERLEAWRDNAALMLQLSEPQHEDRWRNERDNYQNLITLLKG